MYILLRTQTECNALVMGVFSITNIQRCIRLAGWSAENSTPITRLLNLAFLISYFDYTTIKLYGAFFKSKKKSLCCTMVLLKYILLNLNLDNRFSSVATHIEYVWKPLSHLYTKTFTSSKLCLYI